MMYTSRSAICVVASLGLFLPLRAETVQGFTEPFLTVEVSVTEAGTFDSIYVKQGDSVAAGDRLAKLDTDVLESTLAIAEHKAKSIGQLREAEEIVQEKKSLLEKYKLLREREHCSEVEFLRVQTEWRIAQARLLQARENRKLLELERESIRKQLQRRYTKSPTDGIISDVKRSVGESALASDPHFATIVQLKQLRGQFAVPSNFATNLRQGQTVSVQFPELNRTIAAKIEKVSPIIEAKSGTIKVTTIIENPELHFRSGARCFLQFDASGNTNSRNVSTSTSSKTTKGIK